MTAHAVQETEVSFAGYGGAAVRALLFVPDAGGKLGSVVVVHGATGISDDVRELADSLAGEGFLVGVPDLYSRVPNPDLSSLESAMKLLAVMPDEQAGADLEACVAYLRSLERSNGRVGAVGMGGRYAYVLAARCEDLQAVVACYGPLMGAPIDTPELRPLTPLEMAPSFHGAFLGVFGEADTNPSPEHVHLLEEVLRREGKTHVIRMYPDAGHNFLNKRGRNYHPEAAATAWDDIVGWLRQHLVNS